MRLAIPKPLRRHKPRIRPDRVDESLRQAVFKRDGGCFLRLIYGGAHTCRDAYGHEHSSFDLSKMTVDHVHLDGAHMGDRAPSDIHHCVTMCAAENIAGPSRRIRNLERRYLDEVWDYEEGDIPDLAAWRANSGAHP